MDTYDCLSRLMINGKCKLFSNCSCL